MNNEFERIKKYIDNGIIWAYKKKDFDYIWDNVSLPKIEELKNLKKFLTDSKSIFYTPTEI